jgi:hypothetical protein
MDTWDRHYNGLDDDQWSDDSSVSSEMSYDSFIDDSDPNKTPNSDSESSMDDDSTSEDEILPENHHQRPRKYIEIESEDKQANNDNIAVMCSLLRVSKNDMIALYLDAERTNTTKALLGAHLLPENLYSPNINANCRREIERLGANTSSQYLQDYFILMMRQKIFPHVFYFDFLETLLGNKRMPEQAPFVSVLTALRLAPHDRILFAITFAARSGGKGCGYNVLEVSNILMNNTIKKYGWRVVTFTDRDYQRPHGTLMGHRAYLLERIRETYGRRNVIRTGLPYVDEKITNCINIAARIKI